MFIGPFRWCLQHPRLLLKEKLSPQVTDVVSPHSGVKNLQFCFADHHIRPRYRSATFSSRRRQGGFAEKVMRLGNHYRVIPRAFRPVGISRYNL